MTKEELLSIEIEEGAPIGRIVELMNKFKSSNRSLDKEEFNNVMDQFLEKHMETWGKHGTFVVAFYVDSICGGQFLKEEKYALKYIKEVADQMNSGHLSE